MRFGDAVPRGSGTEGWKRGLGRSVPYHGPLGLAWVLGFRGFCCLRVGVVRYGIPLRGFDGFRTTWLWYGTCFFGGGGLYHAIVAVVSRMGGWSGSCGRLIGMWLAEWASYDAKRR